MRKIVITDTTLAEAGHSPKMTLSFKEKVEVARHLENLCVDVIEVPEMINAGTDTLLLRTISAFVKNSTVSIAVGLTEESVEATWQAVSALPHPRMRVSLPVSPVRMEYDCHKKGPKMLEMIETLVRKCVSHGCETEFCAEDATRAEKEFLEQAIQTAVQAGAGIVTVCDDDASMMPDQFAAFAAETASKLPPEVRLGVRCSNRYSMAIAATMQAVQAGAGEIKVSAGGDDTAALETIGQLIRNCGDRIQIEAGLKYTEITRIAGQIEWITHTNKSSQSPFDNGVSEAGEHAEMNLTAGDDMAAVIRAVRKLGYDLSEEDNAKVYESFKRVAGKKPVTARELDAIVASTALQVPPAYKLVSYVIQSSNIVTASAHIQMEKNGKEMGGICLGDGPIDAAFLAIEQIIGHHYELDDFQIQAVTEGREAMGSALVKLRSGGKLYSGKGISTDIIGASIRAYISALNKITYEEA